MECLPKLQQVLGEEIGNLILKFLWKFRGPRSAKIILKKKSVEELTLHHFKTCYKHNNQVSVVLCREKHTGQWKKRESRNRPLLLQSTYCRQGYQHNSMVTGNSFNK